MIANIRHAARIHQTVSIGGGEFTPKEVCAFVLQLDKLTEQLCACKQALEQIAAQLSSHPDMDNGNSKVHFCYYKAVSAFNAANKVEILP